MKTPITKAKLESLALLALVLTAFIYAEQDIWIADLLKTLDPMVMNFWNSIVVISMAFFSALLRRQTFKLPRTAWPAMIGLNLSTLTAWIFTFLALTKASPAVVAAGTLSAPLLLRLVFFEKTLRLRLNTWLYFGAVVVGLVVGAIDQNGATHFHVSALIYCLMAAFGVVGNSYFMQQLHVHRIQGDPVLFYRFLLLTGSLLVYFGFQFGSIPRLNLPTQDLLGLALLTSYVPLLMLYFVHRHLEVFTINLFLALTPVFSIALILWQSGTSALSWNQFISVALIVSGVLAGYGMGTLRSKRA